MKLLLLIGGLLGFAIGFFFSWAEESSGSSCLWHAAVAAYLTAILMRWWGGAWQRSLEEALRHRQSSPDPISAGPFAKASKS